MILNFDFDMDGNKVFDLVMRTQNLDATKLANKMMRKLRQVNRWREDVGDSHSGQPNGLQRADELIDGVQKQSRSAGLMLLAWLIIRFIERQLKNEPGSASILFEFDSVFTDLRAQALSVLRERERAQRV